MKRLSSSFDTGARFRLKGQLHTHTTRSDGKTSPQNTIFRYAAAGHDFLMFADHDTPADYSGLDDHGLLLIKGNEITANGPHMLHVNAGRKVEPYADRQKVIDEILEDGGLAVCNHPNWQESFSHFPQAELERLQGYGGLEIMNGVIRRLYGSEMATDRWDMLLSSGRKVWGFGNDDAHREEEMGRNWNVAWTREKTVEAVLEALRMGSFYVSSGVEISDIKVAGDCVGITTSNAKLVYVTGKHGKRLAEVRGRKLVYRLQPSDEGYVRFTAVGEPDEYAFTQPFFIVGEDEETLKMRYRVSKVPEPPVITGNLSDSKWEKAEPMRRFRDRKTGEPSPFSPEVRILAGAEALYIAAYCPEPTPEEMKLKCGGGDPGLWHDDGLEIFIDPAGEQKGYYHMMVNAAGKVYVAALDAPALSGAAIVKTSLQKSAYIVEMELPLSLFNNAGRLDHPWIFNITRNKHTQPPDSCQWSLTGDNNHVPEKFGKLLFD